MSKTQGGRLRLELSGGLVLACLAALLYCLTLSRHYTADSLLYALTIERGELRSLIDPTHLFLHPLGLLWYRAWQVAGWTGRSMIPLQVFNALAGSICVGLLWSLSRTLSRSSLTAAVIAVGFAVSGGIWLLSVEAEFVTFPLAMQLLILWWTIGPLQKNGGKPWYAVSLGALVAIAICVYLTSTLLILVAVVGFLTADLTQNIKRRQIVTFLVSLSLLVLPIILITLLILSEAGQYQLFQLGGQGSYGQLSWLNIPHGIYAFLRSFGLYPGLVMNDSTKEMLAAAGSKKRLSFFAYYGLIAILMLLPLLCLLRHRLVVWASARRSLFVLGTWSITFAVFAFYWVPGDITFWAPLLAAWWLIVAICSSTFYSARWLSGVVLAVLLLGIMNATQVILPRTVLADNLAYSIARVR